MKALIFLGMTLAATMTLASEKLVSKGVVYDQEGKEKKFTYERYQKMDGDKTLSRAVYKDMDGDVLTEETMVEKDGKLVRYEMQQKQLKQRAWIEVKGDKITYNLKKYRKNNYPITSDMKKNFVVGLQLVDLIRANWDALVKGKEVEFHLGVWHRQETIGFTFSQEAMDDKTLTVKMNPSSMFIRAVVSPLYFTLDKDTKTLIQYKGRTTPKDKRGRDFYDYVGLVKYDKMGKADAPKTKEKETKKKNKK